MSGVDTRHRLIHWQLSMTRNGCVCACKRERECVCMWACVLTVQYDLEQQASRVEQRLVVLSHGGAHIRHVAAADTQATHDRRGPKEQHLDTAPDIENKHYCKRGETRPSSTGSRPWLLCRP
jgi:hypothetical protein